MKTISVWLLILVLSLAGCSDGQTLPTAGVSKKRGDRPWHEKFNWVAEDYFEDPQVIALCKAIEANDLEEIEKLVKAGADVNAQGKGKMTPLLWAFPDGHLPRFQKLLELGADPNVVVESRFDTKGGIHAGQSVTHLATITGFEGYFEQVMKHGGDVHLLDEFYGDSLVHVVVTRTHPENKKKRLKLLIEKGADLDLLNKSDKRPLDLAVSFFGQYDLALLLLEAGANPLLYFPRSNQRVIHVVAMETRVKRNWTLERKKDFERLVETLEEDYGESLEEAKKDLQRWRDWSDKYSLRKTRELLDAEIAERIAREKAAAQTNSDNKAVRDD